MTMKRVPSALHHHLVDDLLGRLGVDRAPAVRAVRVADPRPQQAQVVVDLGDGADRRARVARGRLLVDRDRRRQALDRVDVRLLHLPQELARVGRQRLDVAALALGVDRVEREARLARSGQPGDDHERVARQHDVEVAEVVLTRPGDDDLPVGTVHISESRRRRRSNACSCSQRANFRVRAGSCTLADMIQRVSLITLGVRDLARARRFYEALGWTTRRGSPTTTSSSSRRAATWSWRSGTAPGSRRTARSRTAAAGAA